LTLKIWDEEKKLAIKNKKDLLTSALFQQYGFEDIVNQRNFQRIWFSFKICISKMNLI